MAADELVELPVLEVVVASALAPVLARACAAVI
jgi:hypothetical protein